MNLKELRKTKGLTQQEACEIINIPLRTYKRYEAVAALEDSFKYTQIYNNLLKIPAKHLENNNNSLDIVVVGLGSHKTASFDVALRFKFHREPVPCAPLEAYASTGICRL